jgi:hypothetical protein
VAEFCDRLGGPLVGDSQSLARKVQEGKDELSDEGLQRHRHVVGDDLAEMVRDLIAIQSDAVEDHERLDGLLYLVALLLEPLGTDAVLPPRGAILFECTREMGAAGAREERRLLLAGEIGGRETANGHVGRKKGRKEERKEGRKEGSFRIYPLYTPPVGTGNGRFNFFCTFCIRMAAPYKYEKSPHCLMNWVKSELEHVGRIIAMKDPHLQKSYAMSTLNGMAHLKDALYEAVQDPENEGHKTQLQRSHDGVIRTMKHLIDDFDLDVATLKAFNTEGVLSNLNYLNNNKNNKNNNTRKNRKTSRKANRKNRKASRKH